MTAGRSPSDTNGVVFFCGEQYFTVNDVIDAACFRGELEPYWKELLGLLQCQRRAEELGLEPDEAALQAMSEEFRTAHDLITAEETEDWLEQRGLELDDFIDYFIRQHWPSSLDEKPEPEAVDYSTADDKLRELLRTDLFLSGAFDRLAVALARRVAMSYAAGGGHANVEEIEAVQAQFFDHARIDSAVLPDWLERLGRDERWFGGMMKLEAIHRRQCGELITSEICECQLNALRLDLASVEAEVVQLDSADAAQEALQCVRQDGMALRAVATEGGYPHRRIRFILEDLDEPWRHRFLCASPGMVIGPIPQADGFQLCGIIEKVGPNLGDAEIRGRVERRVLESYFSESVAKCIRWIITPS